MHNLMFTGLWNPEKCLRTCLNFVGTTNKKERTKEEQRERPCCGFFFQFTKYTIRPHNEFQMALYIFNLANEIF